MALGLALRVLLFRLNGPGSLMAGRDFPTTYVTVPTYTSNGTGEAMTPEESAEVILLRCVRDPCDADCGPDAGCVYFCKKTKRDLAQALHDAERRGWERARATAAKEFGCSCDLPPFPEGQNS
jgi:hypothetical protein